MDQTPASVAITTLLHELGHIRERMTDLERHVDMLKAETRRLWESLKSEMVATDELLEVLVGDTEEEPPHHIAHE